jgi:hypothetical protein
MESKNIKAILQTALEQNLPSSQVNLWPAVKERLVARHNTLFQQGETMNKPKPHAVFRIALTTLGIVALLMLAVVTPQGRAFAQNILRFFVRADQDRYPLQSWQMTPPANSSPESPFQLSVREAEELAGYDVLSPVDVPSGMIFVGASYDEKYHIVSQAFGQDAEYIEISLWQQPLEYYQPCGDISQACDNLLGATFVGASAYLETVQIGNQTGEYLEGVWELTNDGPVWNPTPYARHLRWKTETMIFELVYNGMNLGRDDLVTLAASLR